MSFEGLMNNRCRILRRPAGRDSYGGRSADPVVLLDNWPCRVSAGKLQPRENRVGDNTSVRQLVVFMRPPETRPTEHDFLEVVGYPRLNIIDVADPSGMGHHLEVTCEAVKP